MTNWCINTLLFLDLLFWDNSLSAWNCPSGPPFVYWSRGSNQKFICLGQAHAHNTELLGFRKFHHHGVPIKSFLHKFSAKSFFFFSLLFTCAPILVLRFGRCKDWWLSWACPPPQLAFWFSPAWRFALLRFDILCTTGYVVHIKDWLISMV